MRERVTCAMDRNGVWCAVVGQATAASNSVKTACGEAIILPHGFKRLRPTCPNCRAMEDPTNEHG